MNCQEFCFIQLRFTQVHVEIEYEGFTYDDEGNIYSIGMQPLELVQAFDDTGNFGTSGVEGKNTFSGQKTFTGNRDNTDGIQFRQSQLQQCRQWKQGSTHTMRDPEDPEREPFQIYYVYPEQQYLRRNYDCKYYYEIIGELRFNGNLSGGGLYGGLIAGYDNFGELQPIILGGVTLFMELTQVDVIGYPDVSVERFGNMYAEPFTDGLFDAYSKSQRKRVDNAFENSVVLPGDQAVGPEVSAFSNFTIYYEFDGQRKEIIGYGEVNIPWSIKSNDFFSKSYNLLINQVFVDQENGNPIQTGVVLKLPVKFTTKRVWIQEYNQ